MELRNLHQRSGVGPPRRGRAAAARDGVDRTSTPRRARRALPVLVGGLLALAVPTTAVAAPERVFELVSPAAKGGSDVSGGFFATPDGDAVAYGLVYAALLARRRGYEDHTADVYELFNWLVPGPLPHAEFVDLYAYMQRDKKVAGGKLRFVLLEAVGSPVVVDDLTYGELERAYGELLKVVA